METITDIPKLALRPIDAHKGTFGKVLIIGGSVGMSGAPALAGRAALRSGSGLVRVAVPETILPIVAGMEPCYTTIPLAEDDDGRIVSRAIHTVLEQAAENDVLAFGPGVGIAKGPQELLRTLIAQPDLRLVIDADGLNNLAKIPNWPDTARASIILTPHPGEMKTLWKRLIRDPLPDDRAAQAATLAQRTNTTVVLKGASTVVTDAEKIYINTTGNPGMATAGSGDVLTGIVTALAGQGMNNFEAATAAVYIHGLAGDLAAQQKGQISLIATDIIEALGQAFSH